MRPSRPHTAKGDDDHAADRHREDPRRPSRRRDAGHACLGRPAAPAGRRRPRGGPPPRSGRGRLGRGAATRRRDRADRRVRGLRLQGGSLHRAAGGRPGDPDARAPVPRRRGDRRQEGLRGDRRARLEEVRARTRRRDDEGDRRREAPSARHRRRRRRREPRAEEGRPPARAQVPRGGRARGARQRDHEDLQAALLPAGDRARARRARRRGRLALRLPRHRAESPPDALRPAVHLADARARRPLGGVPRVRPRDRVRIRRRAAGRDGRRHLHRLAGLLYGRHRRVPARQGRPAAHRSRRRLLQHDLHSSAWTATTSSPT